MYYTYGQARYARSVSRRERQHFDQAYSFIEFFILHINMYYC